MVMKFKGYVVAPIDGENCYLVERAKGGGGSWEIRVTYHYITGYEMGVDIPGSVDIELLNPRFDRNGKLKSHPPIGPLKQMFMAIAMYDMCISAGNSN